MTEVFLKFGDNLVVVVNEVKFEDLNLGGWDKLK